MQVHPSVLDARFPAGCDTARCTGACCRTGAWLDLAERDRILAHADRVRACLDPGQPREPRAWFDGHGTAADHPSGSAVGTAVRGGRCVFLDRAGRCALQKASTDGVDLKPFACAIFPLTLEAAVLRLAPEAARPSAACCGAAPEGPRTVLDVCAAELTQALGPDAVASLRYTFPSR